MPDRDAPPAQRKNRPDLDSKPTSKISVALLFRLVSVVAMILGWLALVQRSPPETAFIVLVVVGTLLSDVVGLRRLGPLRVRLKAVASFAIGSGVIAFYSALVAYYWQHGDREVFGLLVVTFPFFAFTLALLLRSWTWAAHDQTMRRQARFRSAEDGERRSK